MSPDNVGHESRSRAVTLNRAESMLSDQPIRAAREPNLVFCIDDLIGRLEDDGEGERSQKT
jgi:hypothetical protein